MRIEPVKNLSQVCDRVVHARLSLPFCLFAYFHSPCFSVLSVLSATQEYYPLIDE